MNRCSWGKVTPVALWAWLLVGGRGEGWGGGRGGGEESGGAEGGCAPTTTFNHQCQCQIGATATGIVAVAYSSIE